MAGRQPDRRPDGHGRDRCGPDSNFYEWNIEQGGPLVKNKLWFYGAFRKARYDRPIANTFIIPPGTENIAGAFAACQQNPGSCEQGTSDEKMDNPIVRLTWQMTERNKLAVYSDRALRLRGHAMGALTDQTTASVEWNTPWFGTGSAKWTSTVSSKLLLENGFSFNRERYDNLYQDGIFAERGTAAWYQNARKNDVSTGLLWNASSAQLGNYPDRYNLQGAASYVTGTHNIKAGYQYQWGPYKRWQNANADLYQSYQNGNAFQVTVLNTPLTVQEDLDANLGFYAQDTWTLGRMTLNYGLRYDINKQTIVGQPEQNGRFASVPAYDDMDFPTWKDWSPRLSVVYDLSGNGKTAVRMGFNRFMTAQTTASRSSTTRRPSPPRRCRGPTSTGTTSPRASAAASTCRRAARSTSRAWPRTSAAGRSRGSTPTSSVPTRCRSTSA